MTDGVGGTEVGEVTSCSGSSEGMPTGAGGNEDLGVA